MGRIEKQRKKLLKTGDYTYMLTLPKEWIKKLGWRSKQAVELTLDGKKIIIEDFPNK